MGVSVICRDAASGFRAYGLGFRVTVYVVRTGWWSLKLVFLFAMGCSEALSLRSIARAAK